MDIIWEAPPAKGTRRSKWASVFSTLRDNPDRWAKLYEGKDRNAHSLAGRLRKTYGNEFEIQSRTLDPVHVSGIGIVKQAGVYARYVAQDNAAAMPGTAAAMPEPDRSYPDHEIEGMPQGTYPA